MRFAAASAARECLVDATQRLFGRRGEATYTSHHTPHTTHHTLHITPHTSHLITPHTPHTTPHTPHLTHHTLHITPHNSHLTPHLIHSCGLLLPSAVCAAASFIVTFIYSDTKLSAACARVVSPLCFQTIINSSRGFTSKSENARGLFLCD